ncbi:MAG: hypothetical protein JOZ73_14720 [Solirubrobacterales bacterium]|nr:hypothetical protein [Solirubrobacterales bacterium]
MLILIGYLAPVFYPIAIVPHSIRHVIELNPLYYDLVLFRNLTYGASLSSWQNWVAAFGSGLIMLIIGFWSFSRSWKTGAALV